MTNNEQRNYYGGIKPLRVRVRARARAHDKHMEMNNGSVFTVYGEFIGTCLYVCECSFCYFFFRFFFIIILFYCSLHSTFAHVCNVKHTNIHHLHYACDGIYFCCH